MAPVSRPEGPVDRQDQQSGATPADHRAVSAQLDAQGLLCPLPVIRVQDRIRTLQPGSVLEVLATDPGTLHDVPAWCRIHGHEIIASSHEGRTITIRIRVGA